MTNERQQETLHTLEIMRTLIRIKHTRKIDIYIHPYNKKQTVISQIQHSEICHNNTKTNSIQKCDTEIRVALKNVPQFYD